MKVKKQHIDRWEWDRNHIKEYREKVEPYNDYERMMIEVLNRGGFSAELDMWKNSFLKDAQTHPVCRECHKGKIVTKETVEYSGLTIMTRYCSNPECCFFEKVMLTDEDEVLDYEHKPEIKTGLSQHKFTDEEIKQLEPKIREIEKLWRKERRRKR